MALELHRQDGRSESAPPTGYKIRDTTAPCVISSCFNSSQPAGGGVLVTLPKNRLRKFDRVRKLGGSGISGFTAYLQTKAAYGAQGGA
ncbi:MAG: hypothetical protein LBB22_05085 [Treponema sp.]|nr:hypothetical protein [Treponema sp.]